MRRLGFSDIVMRKFRDFTQSNSLWTVYSPAEIQNVYLPTQTLRIMYHSLLYVSTAYRQNQRVTPKMYIVLELIKLLFISVQTL
jgi:hypothetical protein